MKRPSHDPRRFDVAAAAADAAMLEGQWPLHGFARLADGRPAGLADEGQVHWSVRAQLRPVSGGAAQVWLHLAARAQVWRECQRCLAPVALDLEVARPLRFVASEALAAELDAECEDDVLALSQRLDLHQLVEDELLLALPLVPMHETCPQALPVAASDVAPGPQAITAPRPFAALAQLKRRRGPGGGP